MSTIGERVRQSIPEQYSQRQVAEMIGMPADAFSRALNSKRHFAVLELQDLAEALNLDLTWLVTGKEDPYRVSLAARFQWEENTPHSSKGDIDFVEQVAALLKTVEDDEPLPEMRPLPADPQAIRDELGEWNVQLLADRLQATYGITIIREPSLHTDYSFMFAGRPMILLRSQPYWYRVNWSIAHEVAHLALQHTSEKPTRKHEWPANKFAADFLLPEQELRALPWGSMTEGNFAALIWATGVSVPAMAKRLENLKIPAPEQLRAALRLKTPALLRKHLHALPVDGHIDPIGEREARASVRQFPAKLIDRTARMVEEGTLDPSYLAWVRGVRVDDLEEQWPSGDEHPSAPSPSDVPFDAWFEGLTD